MINCRKTIELLYPFLDRELTEEEYREVREHLDLCPPCARHFQFEAGVLRLVGVVCRSVEAPPSLVERIVAARKAASDQSSVT